MTLLETLALPEGDRARELRAAQSLRVAIGPLAVLGPRPVAELSRLSLGQRRRLAARWHGGLLPAGGRSGPRGR